MFVSSPFASYPPQTIISVPVQTAAWYSRPSGGSPKSITVQVSSTQSAAVTSGNRCAPSRGSAAKSNGPSGRGAAASGAAPEAPSSGAGAPAAHHSSKRVLGQLTVATLSSSRPRRSTALTTKRSRSSRSALTSRNGRCSARISRAAESPIRTPSLETLLSQVDAESSLWPDRDDPAAGPSGVSARRQSDSL